MIPRIIKCSNSFIETENIEATELSKDVLPEMVRMYIMDGKYEEAFTICKAAGKELDEWKKMRLLFYLSCNTLIILFNYSEKTDTDTELHLYIALMHAIFNSYEFSGSFTQSNLEELTRTTNIVDYLNDIVTFLKLIDSAIKPMKDLLESQSIVDMQEAMEFFVAAFQFNIDNASLGILGEALIIFKRSSVNTAYNGCNHIVTKVNKHFVSFQKNRDNENLDFTTSKSIFNCYHFSSLFYTSLHLHCALLLNIYTFHCFTKSESSLHSFYSVVLV